MRERRRKLLHGLAYFVLFLVIIGLTIPVWLPWLLRPVSRSFGFTFGDYQRESYTRFNAGNLTYSNRHVRFSAERVSGSIPLTGKSHFVHVTNWRLEILPKPPRITAPKGSPSVHRVFRQTEKIVARVIDWVPQGSATNGIISWPHQVLQVPSLNVSQTLVTAEVMWSNWVGKVAVTPDAPHQIQISIPSTNLVLSAIARADEAALALWSTNRWLTNTFVLNARFGTNGLLPELATLDAHSPMPASIALRWQTNQYAITGVAEVMVRTNRVALQLDGRGDTNSLTITNVIARGFGIEMTNQHPITIAYVAPYWQSATKLGLRAELAEQRFVPAEGVLLGQIVLSGTNNHFTLQGTDLRIGGQTLTHLTAEGSVQWPLIRGSLHLQNKIGTVTVDVAGPATNLSHSGELCVGPFQAKGLQPITMEARWNGRHLAIDSFSAQAAAGTAVATMTGNASPDGATITNLELREADATHLKLEQPVSITRSIDFDVIRFSGPGGNLTFAGDVDWPTRGKAELAVAGLHVAIFNSFFSHQLPRIVVNQASMAARWDNGPLDFDLSLSAQRDNHTVEAQIVATNDQIFVRSLDASGDGLRLGRLQGSVPATIHPAAENILKLQMDEPLHLAATVDNQSHAWDLLTNTFDVFLTNANARAEISGTLRNPLGRIRINASELRFREALPEVPSFRDLALNAVLTSQTAAVEYLTFSVAGQPVTLKGHMPIPRDLRQLDWRTASADLRIEQASLAPFAPLFRGYASPEGMLRARVELSAGGNLNGEIVIDGASTRPLPNLGALERIEIICRFSERLATVKSVGALGGENVFAVGQMELGPEKWSKGHLPAFELQVHGENLPLSRRVDSLIRGDINMTVMSRTNQAPLIAGQVNLRNSLYLRDLRDLVPGGVESVVQRPPYFSIEDEPFATWQLDLAVTGREFLRVRTPLFVGAISADLTLSGTLKNPTAIGDLSIESGTVRLPFATLPVTQGFVTLSRENPYRPELFINAADRAFGYDVKMSVTGSAANPLIQFSSTPPLSSEQVLLMLTAGEVPRQNSFAFTAQERAQRLALFFGRGLLSQFGLGGDASRLTIRSGENITETGRPTYSVEYELSEDWAVIGQYDQFNDFNLMLKWQVYAR